MKKSLFALAAVGAFAGAAQAQSSVTVYGIMDVGYTNASANISSPTLGTLKQNASRIGNSMESGSRLGFRGNEDLGGGTSAQFVFELGLQPAGNAGSNWNGTNPTNSAGNPGAVANINPAAVPTGSTSGNAGSPNWTPNVRQAFVGLTQKGIGTLRIGTQNTFVWEQAGSNTTGQLVQTLGSMLAPTTDGAFFSSPSITAASLSDVRNGAALGAFTNRTTNTVTFRTERIAGVQAKLGGVLSNQNNTVGSTTGAVGTSNQYGWMAALDWNIAKANIQGAYQVFSSETPTTGTVATGFPASANTVVAPWGSGTQGANAKDAQAMITASYDFGILRAYVGWTDRKITNASNSSFYAKRTAQEIGVRGYATKTIEGWASIGNGRYTAFGNNAPTANITGYQVGSNYWMSKRTNLYAMYGQNNTSSTSAGSAGASQVSVGVRHTF